MHSARRTSSGPPASPDITLSPYSQKQSVRSSVDGDGSYTGTVGDSPLPPRQPVRQSWHPEEHAGRPIGRPVGSSRQPQRQARSFDLHDPARAYQTWRSRELDDSLPRLAPASMDAPVAVRNIMLPNGQPASVIMEQGRIKRIVAANGQVAELRWHQPAPDTRHGRGAVREGNLSVSISSASLPRPQARESQSPDARPTSMPVLPKALGRLASPRKSWQSSHSPQASNHAALLTAPAGDNFDARQQRRTRSMERLRDIDYGAPDTQAGRSLQSIHTAPHVRMGSAPSPNAMASDMPTILETTSQMPKDWNPAGRSWLPPEMTRQPTVPERGFEDPAGPSGYEPPSGQYPLEPPPLPSKPPQYPASSMPTPRQPSGNQLPEGQVESVQGVGWNPSASIHGTGTTESIHAAASSPRTPRQATPRKVGLWARLKAALTPTSAIKNAQLPDSRPSSNAHLPFTNDRSRKKRAQSSRAMAAGQNENAGSHSNMMPDQSRGFIAPPAEEPFIPGTTLQQRSTFMLRTPLDSRQLSQVQPSSGEYAGHKAAWGVPEPAHAHWAPRHSGADPARRGSSHRFSDASLPAVAEASRRPPMEPQDMHLMPSSKSENPMLADSWRGQSNMRAASAAQQQPPPVTVTTRMAGRWRRSPTDGSIGSQVDELLELPSLQRLAREKIAELEIVEAGGWLELVWHIALNAGISRISKSDRYLLNGGVVEGPRRDGRPGMLRSQLTLTPEGHIHIRSLQNEPYPAVFHDRLKLSTGGRRIKLDQKFQLLAPGVLPVKYYSIWHRVN